MAGKASSCTYQHAEAKEGVVPRHPPSHGYMLRQKVHMQSRAVYERHDKRGLSGLYSHSPRRVKPARISVVNLPQQGV